MAKKKNDTPAQPPRGETILQRSMDEMMHSSMLPYAEHVILERALPRAEDGLKPVQRRILYTMMELGLDPEKPHRKSARIVGDCLGKYHPHGDSSVYDAMVHMAQDFSMRAPLVDGHGNFGSIDGDSAAAMRYTEARMTPLAMAMLRDIDADTVSFSLNFDDTLKEPDLLPARFPNLLVNGASGIAVGLATNIPPHNLGETVAAVCAQIDEPDISVPDLMKLLPCPDFPTGGLLLDSSEIRAAYETGRGKLTMRAATHLEPQKNGKTLIVITELPYNVNKANLLKAILTVTQEKKAMFAAVADIRDESDRNGMRAVIEVKKDGNPQRVLQNLFKYSDLQCTFGVNLVAIADGKPQLLNLKSAIAYYIRHQKDVVTRRTRHELENAKKREHILAGLTIAILNLDEVIALIRKSKTPKEAKAALMERFSFTEIQAQAILDLRLQRLTNLELQAIQKEYEETVQLIARLEAILASEKKLMALIKKELQQIGAELSTPRRTRLVREDPVDAAAAQEEETIPAEDVVVAILPGERVRRIPQKQLNEEQLLSEEPLFVLPTATDRTLRLFTNLGQCLTLAVSDLPETRPAAKAAALRGMVELEEAERIVAAFADTEKDTAGEYLFYTEQGFIKRTECSQYRTRAKKVAALTLKEGDALLTVAVASADPILLLTRQGMSIRFAADTVPAMGRVSAGVRGIKLEAGDSVFYAAQLPEEGEVLCLSDKGYAKRSFVFDYTLQGRNGKGLKTFDFKKNGSNGTALAAALHVTEPFEFLVTQRHGTRTRLSTEMVHIENRDGKGSLLVMALLDDDVMSVRPLLPL